MVRSWIEEEILGLPKSDERRNAVVKASFSSSLVVICGPTENTSSTHHTDRLGN